MAAYEALVSLMNTIEQIKNHPLISTSIDDEQLESVGQNVDFLKMDCIKEETIKVKEERRSQDEQKPACSIPAAATSWRAHQTRMVGFAKKLRQLMDVLTREESSRQIISVVRMGGIGGLLRRSNKTVEYWNNVAKNINPVIWSDEDVDCYKLASNTNWSSFRGGWRKCTFPTSLKKLKLICCHIDWDDLTRISSLPHLEVLLLHDSTNGQKSSPADEEFRTLKVLSIVDCDLRCRNADSSHFPVLEKLFLQGLMHLEEIPSDIGEISTLEFIGVYGCSDSAHISAEEIKKQQEELGNERLQQKWDKNSDIPENKTQGRDTGPVAPLARAVWGEARPELARTWVAPRCRRLKSCRGRRAAGRAPGSGSRRVAGPALPPGSDSVFVLSRPSDPSFGSLSMRTSILESRVAHFKPVF
ncbi:hypothetical protein C2S51_024032 [Perilla frutescens var. frutescens]|nr:hypothetical protein C2S51_024032 [Perilla frutescens var. frutescens]